MTHFEGISGEGNGVYTLNADWSNRNNTHRGGSWVVVHTRPNGSFSNGRWVQLDDKDLPGITSSNAVAGNAVVGIVYQGNNSLPYQATVDVGSTPSDATGIQGSRTQLVAHPARSAR